MVEVVVEVSADAMAVTFRSSPPDFFPGSGSQVSASTSVSEESGAGIFGDTVGPVPVDG
ncbi:MAG: hypothetical protein ACE5GB_00710 [Acidimicrobiales bacterium]